ncbi:MAG: (4Fe-4S)-binding protein [Sphingobacterium composti]|uniref:(4Fe-4S)-binding protein n=1 Tax=Sphingobacterium composti TaxID=363260 RepID=UPI00135697E1|nr:(4Fe-4S)-binding protein [Sphingobacterium composti Ten et al. 2007 non Yoo et al. 2007]
MSEATVKYPHPNGEIIILWKPKLCIHAGVCVRMLPDVYKPKERPWCNPENATVEELKEQIIKCPSGALSFELNDSKDL